MKMSTTNAPMRETTVRPSQQSLEVILQVVQGIEARLGKTVGTVKGINRTVQGINTKLDKTIENVKGIGANVCKTREIVKEIDTKFEESVKQLGEFRQSFGAKLDNLLEQVEGLDKKLDELPNLIAIFIFTLSSIYRPA